MLKTIPSTLTPDLLWTLAAMGHGDRIAVVNANYPARSRHDRVLDLPGVSLVQVITDILRLMPLDDKAGKAAWRMVPEGKPEDMPSVHEDVQHVLDAAEGRRVPMQALERASFFELAGTSFAAVHSNDNRPFGCFLLTKGVVRAR